MKSPSRRGLDLIVGLGLPVVFLLGWELGVRSGRIDGTIFSAPSDVVESLRELSEGGALRAETVTTASRALVGWGLAAVIAVLVGSLMGRSARIYSAVAPLMEFARSVPAVTLVPVGLLLFGAGSTTTVLAVLIASVWPVLINTSSAVASTDPLLLDTSKALGFSRTREVCSIQIPQATPSILAGLKTSLALALIVAVVAEMIGSAGGLGGAIIEARSRFRTADVFAIVLVLGAVGLVVNLSIEFAERRLTRWQRDSSGEVVASS